MGLLLLNNPDIEIISAVGAVLMMLGYIPLGIKTLQTGIVEVVLLRIVPELTFRRYVGEHTVDDREKMKAEQFAKVDEAALWLEALVAGSVASQVSTNAPCPVLLVRAVLTRERVADQP